jgi:tetratricopeptide (TPR) repeat protein
MPTERRPEPPLRTSLVAALGAALVVLTFAAFSGVLSGSFLAYDDDDYVTANAHVRAGLTASGVAWALRSTEASNWHPLTWLSHMIDVQAYGLDAARHHLTSLLLHTANVLLLFLLLLRMTNALWRSALVAALFAVHPLHVESVAWIAERKDVLSTLCWLLTIAAWIRYVPSQTAARYATVAAFFALGLMAKPMVVTLPFTLLLVDFWPLARPEPLKRRLWEKAPLFLMSAASSIVTFVAQRGSGSVQTLSGLGVGPRVANAATAYAGYLGKMVWPVSLSAFYPYPREISWGPAIGSALLLLALTILALRLAKAAPYVTFGWLWYVGTLVPVIGLVQVGLQASADRYTYVPLVGIFVAMSWGLGALAGRGRPARIAVAALSAVSLAGLVVVTRGQVRHWSDTRSLFEHALAVTSNNFVAHNNLGVDLARRGKPQEAIAEYEEALRIKADYAEAQNNLGTALHDQGRDAEAVDHLRLALANVPESAAIRLNLGNALAGSGQADAALAEYDRALRLQPDAADVHRNMGNLLHRLGRNDEAVSHFQRAVEQRPDDASVRLGLATALTGAGKFDAALQQFEISLRLNPAAPVAHNDLGNLLASRGRIAESIPQYEQAVRLKPDYAEALNNLGQALAMADRVPESIERFQEAVKIDPGFAQAHSNLGVSLARMDRFPEAIEQFERALEINPGFEQAKVNLRMAQEALHTSR